MWWTLGLVVIFALTTAARAESFELKIKPSGEKFVKSIRTSILFTCEVTGSRDPNIKIQWFDRFKREIVENPTKRIYIERGDIHSKKLYITEIEDQDAGLYECIASTTNSGQQRRSVELSIFKEITFDHVPNPQHPAINTDAVIECQVSGSPVPVVSWRYNERHLDTALSAGGRYEKMRNGLKIMRITQSDDGNYTCRAEVENDGRYDERRITVVVHIPPTVVQNPADVSEVEGRYVSMTCKADGLPAPKFEFYKVNRTKVVLSTDRIQVDADGGRISFRPLKKEDEGEYVCKALNDVGAHESKRARLTVLVPPRILEFHNITKSERDSGTLTCRSTGDPTPRLSFYKEGNPFPYEMGADDKNHVIVSQRGVGYLELFIRYLSPDDAGNYTCVAESTAGYDNKTTTIDVHFKPIFNSSDKTTVFSWAGTRHNMSCNVKAQPMPTIRWIRYGRVLENNETFQIFDSGRQSNLQVRIKEADQSWIYGDYFCRAENSKGRAEQRIELNRATLPGAPQFIHLQEYSPNQVVFKVDPPRDNGGVSIIGYRVEFENTIQDVSVRGNSETQNGEVGQFMSWNKNITTDISQGAVVIVDNLRPGTKYVFRIRAKNEVGVGSLVERMVTTANVSKPFPIKITSDLASHTGNQYIVTWERPKTGGLPIKQYLFRYKKHMGDEFISKSNDWKEETKDDNPDSPILEHVINGLSPRTEYQLQVIAKNKLGDSAPNKAFYFHTVEVSSVSSCAFLSCSNLIASLSVVISTVATKWIMDCAKI